jgi:hypothetical protein
MYVYKTYTGLLSFQVQYSRSWPITSSSCYNSSLVTLTVLCLTASKFKLLICSLSGFALSNVANIFIFMIFVWLLLVANSLRMNHDSFIANRRPGCKPPCRTAPLLFRFSVLISFSRNVLPSRWPAIDVSILLLRKLVLASRFLAMDYSDFQASCHNILWIARIM